MIRDKTDEFYQKYDYLKLDCRKEFYELAKEWFSGAGKWCREYWKAIATAVIMIAAVCCCVRESAASWEGLLEEWTMAMTAGVALSLGQSMTIGVVSGNGCSLITDIEAMVIGGERLSVGQILLNLTVSGGMGTEKIQRKNKKHRCNYCFK